MALIIVRIFDKPDGGVTRTMLPEQYGDGQQAMASLEKILNEYPHHGRNDEQAWWWARTADGVQYRFVIEGA
jgi:hypothetical protein